MVASVQLRTCLLDRHRVHGGVKGGDRSLAVFYHLCAGLTGDRRAALRLNVRVWAWRGGALWGRDSTAPEPV